MKNDYSITDYLQSHYFKRDNFSTLQEMLYTVAEKYSNQTAFVLKDKAGMTFNVSYYNFVRDVESIGISLIPLSYKLYCCWVIFSIDAISFCILSLSSLKFLILLYSILSSHY